ncbi:MAG: hypothetical protein GVY09_14040 [Gammaproteobacteria bacterium]|jgi:hypothetical protein|nr:hypothetical protein [Gammaproteobacteria bacterium]
MEEMAQRSRSVVRSYRLMGAKNPGFPAKSTLFALFACFVAPYPGGGRARLTQGALVEQDARRAVSPRA